MTTEQIYKGEELIAQIKFCRDIVEVLRRGCDVELKRATWMRDVKHLIHERSVDQKYWGDIRLGMIEITQDKIKELELALEKL
jgi:hypothetical protein